MNDLRYPIGPFELEHTLTESRRDDCIEQIAALPTELKRAIAGLPADLLDRSYRPGG